MNNELLLASHPKFCPSETDLKETRTELEVAYADYTSHVSPSTMAMSLQACAYILWLIRDTGARTAIDFGSGFTSYVLRYAGCRTESVDDSPEWLGWTASFLNRYDVPAGELTLWEDYEPSEAQFVVYDFSCGEKRDRNFFSAVAAIAPGGVAVLDDAMHTTHQKSMRDAAQAFHYDIFGLQDFTTDEVGRFCALVIRP